MINFCSMKIKFSLTIASLFIVLSTFAQAKMEFKSTTHDYGAIKEDGGVAETEFEFTNTGNQALVLNNVRATCGCTTPVWSKEPVAPGKTGVIKVGYNPKNRPGNFTKSISVNANSQPSVAVLTIRGSVTPREKTVEEIYPRVMGPLRWKSNYLSLGSMFTTEIKTEELEFINTSDKPATVGVSRSTEPIKIEFVPTTIKPGEKGIMKITYDANKKEAFGSVSDRVYLLINDEKQNTYSVGISLTLKEDFSNLSADQLAKAPIANFAEKTYDFGNITQGAKIDHNFKLTNDGKTNLIIRNVKASCGCTAVKNASIVKPGETIDIQVEFNSRGKRSRQNKSITVVTNDPKNSTTILRITGTVEVPATE